MLYSSNPTCMYDLSVEYFQLQQDAKSITDYFASLKLIHEVLNVILPITRL